MLATIDGMAAPAVMSSLAAESTAISNRYTTSLGSIGGLDARTTTSWPALCRPSQSLGIGPTFALNRGGVLDCFPSLLLLGFTTRINKSAQFSKTNIDTSPYSVKSCSQLVKLLLGLNAAHE
jgi:hypothetical protein